MLFIVRTIFWFSVVIALWPADEENHQKTLKIIKNSTPSISEAVSSNSHKLTALALSSSTFPATDYFSFRPSLSADAEAFITRAPQPKPPSLHR